MERHFTPLRMSGFGLADPDGEKIFPLPLRIAGKLQIRSMLRTLLVTQDAEPGRNKTPLINESSWSHEQGPSRKSQGCNEAGSLLGAEFASLGFCSLLWGWELSCADFSPWVKQVVFSLVLTQPIQSTGSGLCCCLAHLPCPCACSEWLLRQHKSSLCFPIPV